MRGDVLADPVRLPVPTPGSAVELSAVRAGVTETRRGGGVPVLGHHVLVAGATGAGKGSVLWSLIAGLAPAVRTGQVRLCVIDPKGGMELGRRSARCFPSSPTTPPAPPWSCCARWSRLMHERANRLRGRTRLHAPTPAEPLFVIVIDEIAALTAYVTDRKARTEIEQLLGLLLSQGRAVGISVVAAIQDPSKDTLPVRQLFTVRIGLRLTEATQTAMVLGQGARDAGAECDLIPDATPGVGYVMIDGTAEPATGPRLPRHRRRHHHPDPRLHPTRARARKPGTLPTARTEVSGEQHNAGKPDSDAAGHPRHHRPRIA